MYYLFIFEMLWLLFVIVFVSFLSFSDFDRKKVNYFSVVIVGILLSITAGFRNVGGVDTDYAIYKNHYNGELGSYSYELFEPGYNTVVWLGNIVGLSFNLFVFILTSICLLLLLKLIF